MIPQDRGEGGNLEICRMPRRTGAAAPYKRYFKFTTATLLTPLQAR